MKWINYQEEKPPLGVEVLAYHHKWVDEDFNPKGIRVGFLQDNMTESAKSNPYDFVSAYWWNYQDTYMTICKSECERDDDSKAFFEEHLDCIEPEYWMEIPNFEKLSEQREALEEHLRVFLKEVDLEKEVSKYISLNVCPPTEDVYKIAKHFFELGIQERTDKELVEEVYSHLDSIKDTADRMTSGNFMHNKAVIKFSANTIAKVLELMGLKAQKGE